MQMDFLAASQVRTAIAKLLRSRRLSSEHADDVAETLVETSLLGIDTHGIRLLPTYLLELENGRANPRPQFRVAGEFLSAGVFHADNALGVVAANAAMRVAIDKASHSGIAALAVTESNHFGAAGHYARLAARSNMIGMVFSNSDALVTPAAGSKALNGSNPIAIAAPGVEEDGFFLDMATSEVAYSRLIDSLQAKRKLPPALPPIGGYKGQGLGTAVQILCAVLGAMPFDAELTHLYQAPYDTPRRIGHFVVAINIAAFVDPLRFRSRISQLLNTFRECPPVTDDDRVLVAGDRESAVRSLRLREGIPVSEIELATIKPFLSAQSEDSA
jgi:ureidoglycolate dehydrogenase (NAD+)